MVSRTIPSWTLLGLNINLCWHKLLIQLPRTIIHSVLKLALNRFPFNLVWFNDQEWNSYTKPITDGKFGNSFIELEGEACSSSPSGLRLQTMVDKESGYDANGKKIVNHKQKYGIRRRRKAAFFYGKTSPVSLSDDRNAQTGTHMVEATRHGFEFCSGEEKGSNFVKKSTCNTNEKLGFIGDEGNRIRMLEQALEEEKATNAALYLELEKERAAAASAADEAMAMILRLQEDKASIEMEARQYQRMIEEKFTYDEEEMNILKEILVRREKENHLLEREVEAYRQMSTLGDEQEECDFSYSLSKGVQRPSVPLGLDEDPLLMVKQVGNSRSIEKKEVGKGSSWPSKNEISSAGKQSHTAAVCLAGKVGGQDDDAIECQAVATKTVQNFIGIDKTSLTGEELKKNAEFGEPVGNNLHDSTSDKEQAIYDVHVVDDKIDILKEENTKESKLPTGSVCDLRRSSSAVSNEMLEIDAEIEGLRERLRVVRGEREKLAFSSDQRKRVDTHLKLIEELVNQLREFQQLKEPVRQTSLPPLPSYSKVSSNRRRCRSLSDEVDDST